VSDVPLNEYRFEMMPLPNRTVLPEYEKPVPVTVTVVPTAPTDGERYEIEMFDDGHEPVLYE
jgi:hypothetical protein